MVKNTSSDVKLALNQALCRSLYIDSPKILERPRSSKGMNVPEGVMK